MYCYVYVWGKNSTSMDHWLKMAFPWKGVGWVEGVVYVQYIL